ncbi:hypothetical protein [Chryseobacterium foetidum]|uniref:hypothetical protein n=1 Tax=Chryseobacterium foetidum TaxID=2951057 RepID=UPI0021C63494|nr:hypothetical protein [Chryseobacterium foetidum]
MFLSTQNIFLIKLLSFILNLNDSFRNEDDFLVNLLLMGAAFALFAVIIAVFVVVVVSVLLFLLISAGIISTSLLVGFQQKSVSKGFKTFFIVSCIAGSSVVSVLFFWFLNLVYDWWITEVAVLSGLLFGAATGWILGLILFSASKKIVIFIKSQIDNKVLKKNKAIESHEK